MRTTTFAMFFFGGFSISTYGQINPIENLDWNQWYSSPYNQFVMEWEVPATSQDTLVGYNIYRGDELYRFQTDSSLYHTVPMNPTSPPPYSNCPEDFISEAPFWAHVTAVYNAENLESTYRDSVFVTEAMIGVDEFKKQKNIFYPIPTTGIVYLKKENIQKILVFDLNGKMVKKLNSKPQLDLSALPKGIYLLKLIGEEKQYVEKIVLQ